jgi:HEAT repeat protein
MDDRLQIESTPAATEVTVHVDTGKQLATLIEQLKDPDYSVRNAAVQALARQPEKALPLLQSAREKAGPDEQWWIDAAIQQIQQKLAGKEKP